MLESKVERFLEFEFNAIHSSVRRKIHRKMYEVRAAVKRRKVVATRTPVTLVIARVNSYAEIDPGNLEQGRTKYFMQFLRIITI